MRSYTLTQLVLAVTALLALAFVVPACFAMRLNRDRLTRADRDVRAIAEALNRSDHLQLISKSQQFDLLAGPGEPPRVDNSAALLWQHGRTDALAPATPDPWGHRYAVNVGALSASKPDASALWVLSAGPNGIVETPFLEAGARPGGDDIALHVMTVAPHR